jgi:hypothetical protein
MTHMQLRRIVIALFIIFTACIARAAASFEPAFCVLLSGKYGGMAGDSGKYSYQLNQTADSGVIIAQGRERPLGKSNFSKVKKTIVNYAVKLTEESYGSPRDSTDFSGDLTITALDRTTIIRFGARLVVGTLADTSMTGLLRLLMIQVDNSLRLPQFTSKKYKFN